MHCQDIKPGMIVKVTKLESTAGYMVSNAALMRRQKGATGRIIAYVNGHGGDVWWVQHDGSNEYTPYCFTEIEAT